MTDGMWRPIRINVMARVYGAWAAHPGVVGDAWVVTHIKSGHKIPSEFCISMDEIEACQVASDLNASGETFDHAMSHVEHTLTYDSMCLMEALVADAVAEYGPTPFIDGGTSCGPECR